MAVGFVSALVGVLTLYSALVASLSLDSSRSPADSAFGREAAQSTVWILPVRNTPSQVENVTPLRESDVYRLGRSPVPLASVLRRLGGEVKERVFTLLAGLPPTDSFVDSGGVARRGPVSGYEAKAWRVIACPSHDVVRF